jgi:hypothetical protein
MSEDTLELTGLRSCQNCSDDLEPCGKGMNSILVLKHAVC